MVASAKKLTIRLSSAEPSHYYVENITNREEIDVENEKVIPINEAPFVLPRRKGKRTHYQTVYRWATKGTKGSKLASVKIGGIRYTSMEALQRFCKVHSINLQVGDYQDAVESALNGESLLPGSKAC